MSKVLIIHHLEMTWESGYKKFGTSFYELSKKIITHIKKEKYDKVILTRFEDNKPDAEHYECNIVDYVDCWFEYGYGWILEESFLEINTEEKITYQDEFDNIYTTGGNHSEIVFIDDWMENLKYDNVSICGAFDGECIEDLEIALNFVGCKFRRLENLIVG